MKNFKFVLIALTLMTGLLSCNSNSSVSKGKNLKITITVTGADEDSGDYVDFNVVGNDIRNEIKTPFKVNGKERTNEPIIALSGQDFQGATKTYVIETTEALDVVSAAVNLYSSGGSFTFSYKAEVNGKVINDEKNVVVSDAKDFVRQFSY